MSIVTGSTRGGNSFARFVRCLAMADGRFSEAAIVAKDLYPGQSNIGMTLKAYVGPLAMGSNPLADYGIGKDFFEAFRAASIVGQLSTFMRPTPALVNVPTEVEAAVNAAWVGEGAMIPVRQATLGSTSIPPYKLAAIVAVSAELAKLGGDAAVETLRQILVGGVAQAIDGTFLSSDALVSGTSPAGVGNSGQTHVSTGGTAAQIQADLSAMGAKLDTWRNPVWVMRPGTSLHITATAPALVDFSGENPRLCGLPVFTSPASPAQIMLLDAGSVLYFDEGESEIHVSESATLQMGDGGSPESEEIVSLFQEDILAIRIIRHLSWSRPSTGSAVVMTVAY